MKTDKNTPTTYSKSKRHPHIPKEHKGLVISLKEYFSTHGYKLNNNRNVVSIFNDQIKSGVKTIAIKSSFFICNYSILLELLELTPKTGSIILGTAFQEAFNIRLDNKRNVIII